MADKNKDMQTVELTANERQVILQVLKEFEYNVKGLAILNVADTVKSILFKLEDKT